MTFFKTTFEDEQGGAVHGGDMSDEMWKNMLSAQATWDATMGFNAVQALKQANDPKAIMVVLVGSGHVAYGLGIERQARKWFDGQITQHHPGARSGRRPAALRKDTQASYANFTWGVPDEIDSAYPMMGTSTAVGAGDVARRVIIVQDGSPAAQAGVKVGDVLQSFDGVPLTEKETFSRLMAGQALGRLGDARRQARNRRRHDQGRVPAFDRRRSSGAAPPLVERS